MQDFATNFYSTLKKPSEPGDPFQSFSYRKPEDLCSSKDTFPYYKPEKKIFIENQRATIERYVLQQGLTISIMQPTEEDFFGILSFLSTRYSHEQALEICTFDLYRFVEYGHGVLLKDAQNKVIGTVFEVFYDTEERTSYTIRLAVSEQWRGKNLGYQLMKYSCLLAMEKGAKVKRGIIEYHNIPSLHINLNKIGWICDKFYDYIPGLGSFFGIVLPLDPIGITCNSIDAKKLTPFFSEYQCGEDYQIIDCKDLTAISNLYHHTDFKIAALLSKNHSIESPKFLALSKDMLYSHTSHKLVKQVR